MHYYGLVLVFDMCGCFIFRVCNWNYDLMFDVLKFGLVIEFIVLL